MEVTITDSGLQQRTEPLTAVFEGVPSEHDGTAAFALDVRFSEGLGETANAPAAGSFAMQGGRVKDVRNVESGLWQVRVAPKWWKDTTATLTGGRGVHGPTTCTTCRRWCCATRCWPSRRSTIAKAIIPAHEASCRAACEQLLSPARRDSGPRMRTASISRATGSLRPCVVNKGRRPVRGCCKLAAGAPVASRFRPARAFRRPYGLVGTSPVPSGTALDFRWRSRCGNGISIWLA